MQHLFSKNTEVHLHHLCKVINQGEIDLYIHLMTFEVYFFAF